MKKNSLQRIVMEGAMNSVPHLTETLRQILEEEANALAKESGFIQRERVLSGADFAQTLIFGWLAESEITLDGLTQVAGRREVEITASGLCQRFTWAAVDFLHRLLARLTQVRLEAEAAPIALLKRFTAVIVEDSSRISLPNELAEVWRGCGGSQGSSQATLKLFVRWNVLSGELAGPLLTEGRQADAKSPFNEQEVPADGLYLGDQGFFEQGRLRQWHQRTGGHRRYYLMRLPVGTGLYTRSGHRLLLPGVVPQREGAAVELGVLVGCKARVPARLIVQRVPEEVAEQRRQRWRAEAHDQGREPSEETLYLAGWIIEVGCWRDPQRSLVKAAQVVRREAGQLMVALREGRMELVVRQIMRCMRSGCRIEKRKQFPSTVQRLESAPRSVPTLACWEGVGNFQVRRQGQDARFTLNLMPMRAAIKAPTPTE